MPSDLATRFRWPYDAVRQRASDHLRVISSVKLGPRTVALDRYYLELDGHGMDRVAGDLERLCDDLEMPAEAGPLVERELERHRAVGAVGVGIEGERIVYKMYWGFRDRQATEITSIEWQPGRAGSRIKAYEALTPIGLPEARLLLQESLAGDHGSSRFSRDGLVDAAYKILQWPRHLSRAVRVREEGSRRSSVDFDLNLVDSPTVGQVDRLLRDMAVNLQVPAAAFDTWCRGAGWHDLFHLATGRDRHREPFVTVYYGPVPKPPSHVAPAPVA